jgi:hypothetical protein
VEKRRLPSKPAMQRGSTIHEMGEAYLNGELGELPAAYKHFAEPMMELRRAKAIPEQTLAFDAVWQEVDWLSPDVWVRMKLDATVLKKTKARAIDFKTGKEYPDKHYEQIELYALALFAKYPDLKTVDCELWYLDLGDEVTFPVRRAEEMDLRAKWAARARKLTEATAFPPNPAFRWCKNCGHNTKKGGVCTDGV